MVDEPNGPEPGPARAPEGTVSAASPSPDTNVPAPSPPDAGPTPTPTPPDAGPTAAPWWHSGLLWTIIGSLTGLLSLIIALVAMLLPVLSGDSGGPEGSARNAAPVDEAPQTPTGPSTTSEPSAAASSAAASSAGASQWARGPGTVFLTGSPRLRAVSDASDIDKVTYDLDTNTGFTRRHLGDREKFDLSVDSFSLGGENGTTFARWASTDKPGLEQCGALPASAWGPSIAVADLTPGAVFCLISGQGRYGYLVVSNVEFVPEGVVPKGAIRRLNLSYVLWKKPGD